MGNSVCKASDDKSSNNPKSSSQHQSEESQWMLDILDNRNDGGNDSDRGTVHATYLSLKSFERSDIIQLIDMLEKECHLENMRLIIHGRTLYEKNLAEEFGVPCEENIIGNDMKEIIEISNYENYLRGKMIGRPLYESGQFMFGFDATYDKEIAINAGERLKNDLLSNLEVILDEVFPKEVLIEIFRQYEAEQLAEAAKSKCSFPDKCMESCPNEYDKSMKQINKSYSSNSGFDRQSKKESKELNWGVYLCGKLPQPSPLNYRKLNMHILENVTLSAAMKYRYGINIDELLLDKKNWKVTTKSGSVWLIIGAAIAIASLCAVVYSSYGRYQRGRNQGGRNQRGRNQQHRAAPSPASSHGPASPPSSPPSSASTPSSSGPPPSTSSGAPTSASPSSASPSSTSPPSTSTSTSASPPPATPIGYRLRHAHEPECLHGDRFRGERQNYDDICLQCNRAVGTHGCLIFCRRCSLILDHQTRNILQPSQWTNVVAPLCCQGDL